MQKRAVRKNLTRVLRKADEKVELLRCEVCVLAANHDAMLWNVDQEIADSDDRLRLAGGSDATTQLCANAGQQLLNAKRFGDVVVRARVQRLDLHSIMVADGQNKNRYLRDGANLTA